MEREFSVQEINNGYLIETWTPDEKGSKTACKTLVEVAEQLCKFFQAPCECEIKG